MRDMHICLNCGTTTDAKASRLPDEVRERAVKAIKKAWGPDLVPGPWVNSAVDAVAEVLAEHESEVNRGGQLTMETRYYIALIDGIRSTAIVGPGAPEDFNAQVSTLLGTNGVTYYQVSKEIAEEWTADEEES